MFICVGCGLECADSIAPGVCPKCFRPDTYVKPNEYKPALPLFQIADIQLPRIPTGEKAVDEMLYGGFIKKTTILLWGRGGTGKSRLAMRWGTGTVNCLYITLEMIKEISAQSARSMGIPENRLFLTESYDNFSKKARECNAEIVVLDSISVIKPKSFHMELLGKLTSWADRNNGVAIAICHQNKYGQHAGSHAIQHWGDSEIFLKHSKTGAVIVEVKKSRGCPTGKCKTVLSKEMTQITDNETTDEDNEKQLKPGGRLRAI